MRTNEIQCNRTRCRKNVRRHTVKHLLTWDADKSYSAWYYRLLLGYCFRVRVMNAVNRTAWLGETLVDITGSNFNRLYSLHSQRLMENRGLCMALNHFKIYQKATIAFSTFMFYELYWLNWKWKRIDWPLLRARTQSQILPLSSIKA